ncbi:MAG: response regulator transcription factor [Rhodothermales bacterium]|nr:response regulator transcription factor [Rhodothermales bacterium]
MEKIRVLIVDDEPLARDVLRLLIEARSDVEVIGEAANGSEAVKMIEADSPDLVLLDIQMPDLTGIEVVQTIGPERMPVVVFATAYDEYALEAFEAQALDYILKPIEDDRFDRAIDRAVARIREDRLGGLSDQLVNLLAAQDTTLGSGSEEQFGERIMVKDRDSVTFVKTGELDWVEAAGDYVVLHEGKKTHMLRESMTGMEKRLDPTTFVRIHRSTIVNIERIKEMKSYFHGDYIVYLHDGQELRLSRRYWKKFEAVMGGR